MAGPPVCQSACRLPPTFFAPDDCRRDAPSERRLRPAVHRIVKFNFRVMRQVCAAKNFFEIYGTFTTRRERSPYEDMAAPAGTETIPIAL